MLSCNFGASLARAEGKNAKHACNQSTRTNLATNPAKDRTVTADDADVTATKQLACFGTSRDVIYGCAAIDRERLKDV